jgi:uncharacterized protein involved in outer membrane biogenesis
MNAKLSGAEVGMVKKLGLGLGLLAVVLLGVALAAPGFIDWNPYRAQIAAKAREITGRAVVIDGPIEFSLLPAPALSVHDIRLANVPGAQVADMLRLDALKARLALMPLLRGRFEVEQVVLVHPVIALEVLADGAPNWRFGAPDGKAKTGDEGARPDVSLDRFVIKKGRLAYHNQVTGATHAVSNINAVISARSLDGPFQARGTFDYHDVALRFEGTMSEKRRNRPVALQGRIELADQSASAALNGRMKSGETTLVSGKLSLKGDDLAQIIATANRMARHQAFLAPAGLHEAFELSGAVRLSEKEVRLTNANLSLGEMTGRGEVGVTLGKEPKFRVLFNSTRLDLDHFVAAVRREKAAAGKAAGGKAPGFSLPDEIAGEIDVSIDAIALGKGVARQAQITASLQNGALTISRAGVLLPGGSDVLISGVLTSADGKPGFTGKLRAASNNFHGLLEWLGTRSDFVPADRLTKLSLSSTISITPQVVQLHEMDMRFDTSHITGALAYALRARPSFSADLTLDRLNVDAYLASAGDKAKATPQTPASGSASPAALLGSFDSNLRARIGQLVYHQTAIRTIDTDLSLLGGVLTVKKLTIGNLAGAQLSLSGSARELSGRPQLTLKSHIKAADLGGLAQLTGLALPAPAAGLGALDASLDFSGDIDRFTLDLTGRLGGARLALKGTASGATGKTPRLDMTLDARAKSLAAVIRQFALDLAPPRPGTDAPLSLKASVKGAQGQLAFSATASVARAALAASGQVTNQGGHHAYGLKVTADHDELRALLRGLGVDYNPAGKVGRLSLAADVTGDDDGLTISDLTGVAGPAAFSGQGRLDWSGARPKLIASLKGERLLADVFMPPAATGARQAHRAATAQARSRARWSRRPFRLGWLDALDAELSVTAQEIAVRNYRFIRPRLALTLSNGVLDVRELTGRLFGGDLRLTASLRDPAAPRLDMTLALDGADVAEALRAVADLKSATGVFSLDGRFAAHGRNQFEMISSLAGTAQLDARDGVIRGIDLPRLSAQLGSLDRIEDFVRLTKVSLSGGQTRYQRLRSVFEVKQGVARATEVTTEIAATASDISAVIDLPRWEISLRSRFRLTDHPEAPAAGLDLSGPLDAPRRALRYKKLKRYIAGKLGTAVLRQALENKGNGGLKQLFAPRPDPGSGAADGAQAQPQAQPDGAVAQPFSPAAAPESGAASQELEPIDPGELLLRGIFKKLLKKKNKTPAP